MASSRVMVSAPSSRADLARRPESPLYPAGRLTELNGDRRASSLGSMNMEELLRNFYADNSPAAADAEIAPEPYAGAAGLEAKGGGDGGIREGAAATRTGGKTAEEVWREISRERKLEDTAEEVYKEEGFEEITLEAFLARAGAVTDDDIRAAPMSVKPQGEGPVMSFGVDAAVGDRYAQQQPQQQLLHVEGSLSGFGNSVDCGAGGRGKKRPVEDPVDKVAEQKQRRMIKNRESAARSRERKQAYILELEASVTRLEHENARLLREQEEQEKARLKQLMENLIPVVEMKRPLRSLRRTCSAHW